jgi:TDG/mug DNA glycosylase family protein
MAQSQPHRRPTRVELEAAVGRTIPDLVAPNLRVLFCGINPGLVSGVTGFHFARPGNRFWRTIHEAGLTDELLTPDRQHELLETGIGITNLVARTTASAAELTTGELRAGGRALTELAAGCRPRVVALLGIDAYRTAFDAPGAGPGRQERSIGRSTAWLLPNPSGLNASYQLPELVRLYAELRLWLEDNAESPIRGR